MKSKGGKWGELEPKRMMSSELNCIRERVRLIKQWDRSALMKQQ